MQRVISRVARMKFRVSRQRPTHHWDGPASDSRHWVAPLRCNLHSVVPTYNHQSNQHAEESGIDGNQGCPYKRSATVESDSLEKESSTFSQFENVRNEMAKEGKHADEPDTQPGYWEESSSDKEGDKSSGESEMSGPASQNKLKESGGGIASDKEEVTSEPEEGLGSGPAERSPVPPGSTEKVKVLED